MKSIVLDANILIRACLGERVFKLLRRYSAAIRFLAPLSAFFEAERHLVAIFAARGMRTRSAIAELRFLREMITAASPADYATFEREARRRIALRDPEDWPVVALALAEACPIWTEDRDFFGCGVATWTSNRVEIYLED